MQVSIKWLHDYIDFTETAEELADKLTMAGVPAVMAKLVPVLTVATVGTPLAAGRTR